MAAAFNLTAQINLRGPTNTRAIASQMRKQLSGIKVKVDLDLKGAAAKNVANINKQLQSLSRNAALANKNVTQLNQSIAQLGAGLSGLGSGSIQSLTKIQKQTSSAGKSIDTATSQIQEFGKQSGLAIRRFAAFSAVTGVVYSLTNAVNSAYKEFVQFDRQLIRLSQVTGSSVAGLQGITNEITRLSTNLGVASTDLLQISVTLAQAGLSAQEAKTALEALAKSALAPSFDNLNDTVEGSIALMKQFSISSSELEASLGSINAVAAAFAVEAGDIIKAIQRTGGVFASASQGVSQGTDALNEFVALFTSVRATTREGAETIATGLRTIFTRIQRGSTIEALKEYGITLTDLEGKFVGPYEAVRRLSEGLQGLDPRDVRFGQIVEELGGFRQIGKVIPLIQQYTTAQQALAVAQGGQSSLSKAAIQAQASLAVQFEKTRQSFVALVRDIGNSTTFRTIASVSLTTANAFISLAGALKPLLPMLTALAAIKGASILSEFGSGFLGGLGKTSSGGGGATGGMPGGGGGGGGTGRGTGGGTGGGGAGGSEKDDYSDVILANTAAISANTDALTSQITIMSSNTDALSGLMKTMADLMATMQELNGTISNLNIDGGDSDSGLGLNKGGPVPRFASGGKVPGTGNRDTVEAMLTPGEYVNRKKAVEKIGVENLEQLNRGRRIKGYARGGRIEKIQAHDAYDGDSWHVSYIPESSPVGPMTSRGEGYDAYEIKKGLAWERALGQRATEIAQGAFTDSRKMSIDHSLGKALTQGQSVGGRPVHSVPNSIVNQMVAEGVALRTSNKDNVATGKVQSEKVKATQLKTLESMGNKKLVYDRERSKLASGGMVQKFAGGGGVKQGEQFGGVGIFDSDMIGAGSKDVLNAILSSGKDYDVISGPAGSGKTTFATQRFGKNFVLSADDLDKFKEFMVLSSAGETKSGDFSPQAQSIMSGARQITALIIPAEKITQQRQQRLDDALRSGSQDKRSTKQLQGTINAPTSIPQNLYDQFSNVEFLEQFASGGLVQRFDDGGDVGGIKVAKTGKINKSDIERLTEKQAAALLENPNVQKNLFTVSQLQKRIQQRQAVAQEEQELVGAKQYGLVGLYGSPRNVTAKTEDGDTVQLIGKTLDKKLSDEYEKMMTDGFEQTVAVVGNNMASRVGASAAALDKNQMEKAGLYNAIGAYLEAAIATLGAPYDKDETNDTIDFAGGIGNAAALFGIPSDIPTDTTRTVFGKGKSPNDFLGQVNRYRKQIQRFANGGSPQDTVPALLTPGEFVINKEAAKKLGSQKLNQLNKADRIQGFNKGGAVGFVQRFAGGGSVEDDKAAYVARMAEKLGMTVEKYEKMIRARIMNTAAQRADENTGYQIDIQDIITKNMESIGDADVEGVVRAQVQDLVERMYGGVDQIDPDVFGESLDDLIDMMKKGLSLEEIKAKSAEWADTLDSQIDAIDMAAEAQEKMAKELGFLTEGMKTKDIDFRAQKSLSEGKFGAFDKMDLRGAQESIESGFGKILDDIGTKFSTANLPGMARLSSSFPDVADKITMIGDKMGGLTGILGAGSTLLASKLPQLIDSFDKLTGTVSDHSEAVAGVTGALKSAGSFGLSGAVLGQQAFGRRGAAVGGAIGLAGGAVSGFIKESTAKEVENAMRGVTEASSNLDKTLSRLDMAQTIAERQELVKQLNDDYEALNQALSKSAQEIESNRIWNALSSGLEGFLSTLSTVIGFMAAARMTQAASMVPMPMGRGRRRGGRRGMAIGGRVGYSSGSDGPLVPVHLAAGEGVLSPEVASQFSDMQLQRLNNADKNGYGANPDMLDGAPMGIVPGKGSGKVDNFKTNLPANSYVIKSSSMDALRAATGGKISSGSISAKGYSGGGSISRIGYAGGGIARQGHFAGGIIGKLIVGAIRLGFRTIGPTLTKGLFKIVSPVFRTIGKFFGSGFGTMLTYVLGDTLLSGISGFFDNTAQEQQLAAQIASLEQLRKLVDLETQRITRDPESSRKFLSKVDTVERANLTAEQRRAQYASTRDASGGINDLNVLLQNQARAKLSGAGYEMGENQTVQEYLDTLSGDDRIKAEKIVVEASEEVNKRLYLQRRERQGIDLSTAQKEYESSDPEMRKKVARAIAEESGAQNRSIALNRQMIRVNRELQKFTLNLTDVMNRLGATMNRVTSEIAASSSRLSRIADEYSGGNVASADPEENAVRTLSNITAYSSQELAGVVDNINASLGDTKETRQMGDLVKGLQVMRKELPLILRDTADSGPIDAGAESNIRDRLQTMFTGVDIDKNIKKDLEDSIINYISDSTGNRQGMSYEDLANNIKGLEELDAAAEKARSTFEEYAKKQVEANRVLGGISNQLAGQLDRLKDNVIKVRDIQLQSANDLADKFNRTISLADLNAPFMGSVSGLTGGTTDAAKIGSMIAEAIAQKRALEADPNTQTSALGSGQIAKLTSKINSYQRALDILATSTDRASNALKKIDEQQRISAGRRSGVMDFLANVNNPEALMQMRQEQVSYSNVMAGTGTVNDIAQGISSLRMVESTQTPEEFARTQEAFFNNAMTILENAGGNPATIQQFRDTFAADLAPQDQNPAIQPFVDAYQEAIKQQTLAVEQQSKLIGTGAELTANALRQGADDFTSRMKTATDNIVAELNAVADRLGLGRPADSQGLATGGIVYAAAGQMINFQPRGTDTVPAMLTPGEFVVNRAATAKNLPLLNSINSGNYYNGGQVEYRAKGGQIGTGNTTAYRNFGNLKRYNKDSVDDYEANKDTVPFDYMDFIGNKDGSVSDTEVTKLNKIISDHKKQYFSHSNIIKYQRAKVLIPDWKEKEKEGQPWSSTSFDSLKDAREFAIEMEAAHGIPLFGKDSVGNASTSHPAVTGKNYGGDPKLPMEPNVRSGFNDIFERSIASRNAVDLEAYFYGLASKALLSLGGIIGGGLGVVAGTAVGVPTAGVGSAVALPLWTIGGAMAGNLIGHGVNSYAYSWLPSGWKDRIVKKVQENPGSYSAGQWTGFAAEMLLSDAGANAVIKGLYKTATPRILAKAVANTKTGVSAATMKVGEAVEKGRKLIGQKAAKLSRRTLKGKPT